jgi:hypothetical protein
MIQEILNSISLFSKKVAMPREMTMPTGAKAVLTLDASGNEVLHIERKDAYYPAYMFSGVDDLLNFIRSIPERYGVERAAKYRELYVYTESDIPVMFSIADSLTENPVMSEQLFTLREHPDFTRWFSGQAMDQTDFRSLLLELPDQHDQQDLVGPLSMLSYRVEINYEASVETERNVQLAYAEKELRGSVVIPKTMTVTCPVIAGTAMVIQAVFNIMIVKPKSQTDKIKFKLVPCGKTAEKIKQEACLAIAENEFVKPAQEIISGFATTVPALYLRANIKRESFNAFARFDTKVSGNR